MYHLIDTRTGAVVRKYAEDKVRFARNAADRMDSAYGAVRYVVRWVA